MNHYLGRELRQSLVYVSRERNGSVRKQSPVCASAGRRPLGDATLDRLQQLVEAEGLE
jgi:hypothetical protein